MPMMETRESSLPVSDQGEQRAEAGGGQRGENRDRMDEAFVEHAEDDVNGDERGEDEQRLGGERGLKNLRRALESCRECPRACRSSRAACWMIWVAWPSETPGARLNEIVTHGNCPWWLTERGVLVGFEMRDRAQRHLISRG